MTDLIPKPTHEWEPPKAVTLGDSGEYIVMYGHVPEPLARIIAAHHYLTETGMTDETAEMVTRALLNPGDSGLACTHRWAIVPDPTADEPILQWARRVEQQHKGVQSAGKWEPITERHSGAFPITVLETGA